MAVPCRVFPAAVEEVEVKAIQEVEVETSNVRQVAPHGDIEAEAPLEVGETSKGEGSRSTKRLRFATLPFGHTLTHFHHKVLKVHNVIDLVLDVVDLILKEKILVIGVVRHSQGRADIRPITTLIIIHM